MNGWRQLATILWPSFLVACGMEVLVFALFDPLNTFCGADALRMSRQSLATGRLRSWPSSSAAET